MVTRVVSRGNQGSPTGEFYDLRPDDSPVQFKVSTCSLSADHICISGFRESTTAPLVLIIARRARLCSMLQTSIPVTACLLSPTQPDTVLLGMKDGTLLRVPLPVGPSKKQRAVFTFFPVEPAVRHKSSMVISDPTRVRLLRGDFSLSRRRPTQSISGPEPGIALADADQEALAALRKARPVNRVDVFVGSADHVLHVGKPSPVTRIVEHGKRIVASTPFGLHLFRFTRDVKDEDRRITMALKNNTSFDWRGNLLAVLKNINSVQVLQLYECRLEVTLSAPAGMRVPPPETRVECAAISLHDRAMIIVHQDGSRRVVELKVGPHPTFCKSRDT